MGAVRRAGSGTGPRAEARLVRDRLEHRALRPSPADKLRAGMKGPSRLVQSGEPARSSRPRRRHTGRDQETENEKAPAPQGRPRWHTPYASRGGGVPTVNGSIANAKRSRYLATKAPRTPSRTRAGRNEKVTGLDRTSPGHDRSTSRRGASTHACASMQGRHHHSSMATPSDRLRMIIREKDLGVSIIEGEKTKDHRFVLIIIPDLRLSGCAKPIRSTAREDEGRIVHLREPSKDGGDATPRMYRRDFIETVNDDSLTFAQACVFPHAPRRDHGGTVTDDNSGVTALHMTAAAGHVAMIAVLLEAGTARTPRQSRETRPSRSLNAGATHSSHGRIARCSWSLTGGGLQLPETSRRARCFQ